MHSQKPKLPYWGVNVTTLEWPLECPAKWQHWPVFQEWYTSPLLW